MPAVKKAGNRRRASIERLEEIINIGPSLAADLRLLGVMAPLDLIGRDPYQLYRELCVRTRSHQDPCVLDVFIAAVHYMEGAPPRPWWRYTAERKRVLAGRAKLATAGRR